MRSLTCRLRPGFSLLGDHGYSSGLRTPVQPHSLRYRSPRSPLVIGPGARRPSSSMCETAAVDWRRSGTGEGACATKALSYVRELLISPRTAAAAAPRLVP